jgi:hypothetical protein
VLATHDYLASHYALDRAQKKLLRSGTLFVVELVDSVARLCCMNLLLHGIGESVGPMPPSGAKDAGSGDPAYTPGDAEAKVCLAQVIFRDPSLYPGFAEALRCLKEAAEQVNADAQGGLLSLAWLNALQEGKPNGSEWQDLQASAEKGNRKAEVCLGFAYLDGQVVAEDEAESLHWFLRAAGQQEILAESFVASAYLDGVDTDRNARQAVQWTRRRLNTATRAKQINGPGRRDGIDDLGR